MEAGVLLDTHVLQWWWWSPGLLSEVVRVRLSDANQRVVVSAASWLELSAALDSKAFAPQAFQAQALQAACTASGVVELLRRFPQALAEEGFRCLPIQPCHLQRAGRLREPPTGRGEATAEHAWRLWVDRLLVAQAQQERLRLVSLDPALAALGEPLLW